MVTTVVTTDKAIAYNNIGQLHSSLNKLASAFRCYKKSFAGNVFAWGLQDNPPYIAESNNNIEEVYDSLGEYQHALEYYRNSLVIKIVYGAEANFAVEN